MSDADTVYPYEHQMPNQLGVDRGNSDLLVELSALSSAASVTGRINTSSALDIVIVMDTSGSMDDPMPPVYNYTLSECAQTEMSYSDLYSLHNENYLYYKIGNNYVPLNVSRTTFIVTLYTIYYTAPGANSPTYIANGEFNNEFTLAYDLYVEPKVPRLDSLKAAVNTFIDQTRVVNNAIPETTDKHRISLVEFSSQEDSRTLIGLTYVDSNTNVNTLKASVNGLSSGGATRADTGMQIAESTLIGENSTSRADAQKVVIFFTDGTPTTSSSFSGTVANNAIASAKNLKDAGAVIYTIGVFEEADPADLTKNFNQYMHGVSSNYPNATAYTTLGNPVANPNYYLTATDSASLNSVFSEVLEEVTSLRATAATQVTEGNEDASGYITFVDPLGKYMQVDDFKAISFAEDNYTNPQKVEDGNKVTYTFTGANTGNPMYPTTGNLNQIIIEVQKSDTLSVGDVVTVKIPGALIPIHYYEVDIDEDGNITMKEDTTMPIRIWYGVSVKPAAEKLLENPDAELAAYMAANTDAAGNVNFYSNLYEAGAQHVYSTFEPNQKNNFYFFQNDEYLFTDAACTVPATVLDEGTTYYYQRDYYNPVVSADPPGSATEAEKLVNTTAVTGAKLAGYVNVGEGGQLYVPKGAPRTSSIHDYAVAKTDVATGATNRTGTSDYAIQPAWINVMANPTTVHNELGNNGIVKKAVSGTLSINKTVAAADGLTAPDEDFTFAVALTAPAGEALKDAYDAQIFAADGSKVGNVFTFDLNNEDVGTITLKAGQTAYIYGLADGTSYTVTEPTASLPAGFNIDGTGTSSGQIASGEVSAVAMRNVYSVTPYEVDADALGLTGTKTLVGRPFQTNDHFEFRVTPTVFSPTAPLPSNVSNGVVAVDYTTGENVQSLDFHLGEFSFDAPGEYHYEIREVIPSSDEKILGISYDPAVYRVVIKVEDNGAGALRLNDLEIDTYDFTDGQWDVLHDGATLPGAQEKFLQFENEYAVDEAEIVLRGTKTLQGKDLVDYNSNPFTFKIEAGGVREAGSTGEFVQDNDQPMPATTVVAAASTGDIVFPNITFGGEHDGKEYKYLVSEVIPTDAQNNVYEGVTYDADEEEIIISVSGELQGADTVIVANVDGNQFAFENRYQTAAFSYEIKGVKNLSGRDFKEGDAFTFEIEAVGDAPAPSVASKTINPTSDDTYAFDFATISFNQDDMRNGQSVVNTAVKEKTFTYKLREVDSGAGGITYDTAERTLTLKLKDEKGVLSVVEAKANGDNITDGEIVWNNAYNASVVYGGINVDKTLENKAMEEGEFSFTITAENGKADLPATDTFSIPFDVYYNPANNLSTVAMEKFTGVTFTQDDVGQTYTYLVQEQIGTDTHTTYDQSQYRVAFAAYDNGNGTMGVKTTVTQLKNAAGETVSDTPVEYDTKNAEKPTVNFVNSYDVQDGVLNGATHLNVRKLLFGREWNDTDVFKFTLALQGNVPDGAVEMPAETTLEIGKDTAQHAKAFGDITFTQEGTYTFTVTEEAPDGRKKDGVSYDENVSEIVVEVSKDGGETLNVQVKSTDTLTFVNTYAAEGTANATINGKKKLTGKDLTAGAFIFELYYADENFVPQGSPAVTTNDISGSFVFNLDYDATQIGQTFHYVLREKNFGETIEGIKYDDSQYHVTVSVEDNGIGGVQTAKVMYKGTDTVGEIVFENKYTAAETNLELSGTKVLKGRTLQANEFTFNLFAADAQGVYDKDNALQSKKNAASGAFEFEKVEFTTAGTYYYVVAEDTSTAMDNVTFDQSEYLVKVEVTDDGLGRLVATPTITLLGDEVDGIAFENVYTAPTEPEQPTPPEQPDESDEQAQDQQPPAIDRVDAPQTGDNRNLWLWLALLFSSGMGFVIANRKREEETENA